MDIIALSCDIDYCLFLMDKQIVADSMEGIWRVGSYTFFYA